MNSTTLQSADNGSRGRLTRVYSRKPAVTVRQRMFSAFSRLGALLLIGGIYAVWLHSGGISVPCIFHLLTGLKCPSCGVTDMCMALLRFDFTAAWNANPVMLCLLPVFVLIAGDVMFRYIKTGSALPGRWATVCIWGSVAVLLMFGVFRNIFSL